MSVVACLRTIMGVIVVTILPLTSHELVSVAWAQNEVQVTESSLTPEQARAKLRAIGGVLMHYNDRLPDRPVIMVEFSNHSKFEDQWLKYVAALPQLSGLGLAGTSLTDEGLKYVKLMSQLETLILVQTRVTDRGLVHLRGLTILRVLDLSGTQVTDAGVAQLRKALPALEVNFDALPGNSPVADSNTAPPKNPDTETAIDFSAAKIKQLRQQATQLTPSAESLPRGWSKSRVDPARLVGIFHPLRLKKGFALRAYQFADEGNGNGVVWAMPESAEFPEPSDCPVIENHLFKAPKPWDACDDVMEAIDGDDSPSAYLAASLLRRELLEFGAIWHGCVWGAHVVLDRNPWTAEPSATGDSPMDRPTSPAGDWTWLEPRPTQWMPQVSVDGDRVTVTFYTYCGLWKESVVRHRDTYRRGDFRPRVEEKKIAQGSGGFAF